MEMRERVIHRGIDELKIEARLLGRKWWVILLGVFGQYVHGMFTAIAYRFHEPSEHPLKDLGFLILPELGEEYDWVSESLFWTLFISFLLFSFTPFVSRQPRFFTVVLFSRFLCILVTCQMLRSASFLSTGLPGPAYHCRLGKPTAHLPWPKHWWGNLFFDVSKQASHSCGDLLFSSHTTFILIGAYTYSVYGSRLLIKAAVWAAVAAISVLIVASRKHYTVDVVVAWYVVPLVFFTWKRTWKIQRDPRSGALELEGTSPIDEENPKTADVVEEQRPLVSCGATAVNGRFQHSVEMSSQPLHAVASLPTLHSRSGSVHSRSNSAGGDSALQVVVLARAQPAAPDPWDKIVSSPPPGTAVVPPEGISSSRGHGRGGSRMTNRSSAGGAD
mmetsp:Transcript_15114/g.45628  ORF Transcript_15114/g.45628 Transcript_15114/m.45628 type:complete len:388 (+) Transcript_15114:311-1474(+)|eukprot:CAMPEP_0206141620 /NCGR_PEP_ID=MMETSP1473-20131121/13627_1 /ASSEMBLY_ACC=CAM_ASM_001109 /TAXON_ID=1461547 /ORGANISM="Stichococcus sp, Strain RCC1054" /LENGTH=387 /DNA_ID=CAMNT_0053536271 /DNA_START=252 /DNA_END=1415 /DNA_ORIENTATION=+